MQWLLLNLHLSQVVNGQTGIRSISVRVFLLFSKVHCVRLIPAPCKRAGPCKFVSQSTICTWNPRRYCSTLGVFHFSIPYLLSFHSPAFFSNDVEGCSTCGPSKMDWVNTSSVEILEMVFSIEDHGKKKYL